MAPPQSRSRKFHRRSKNGCTSCKKRHVRCDERKPLCTNCLQLGNQCVYVSPPFAEETASPASTASLATAAEAFRGSISPATVLPSHPFVGFANDYPLSTRAKWLLYNFAKFYVRGQTPAERVDNEYTLQRTFDNPGFLHGSLIVAACQWAWVTGSLDQVKVPFLHHKTAAYEFARQQLQDESKALTHTTMFAIATLALAEGAVGDLDASSKHLRGLRELSLRRQGYNVAELNLAQQMLEMARIRLRSGEVGVLRRAIGADYQPTVIALLFTSLWDVNSLPPREAPRYGWWKAGETNSDRLWQGYTRNLNWEISRGFDPEHNLAVMLNSDAKSSRASYIATFFYLMGAINDGRMDSTLAVWLLEQLIDDLCATEAGMVAGTFSRQLWFWTALFGAAVAALAGQPSSETTTQIESWRAVYAAKLRLASMVLELAYWDNAKSVLGEVAWCEGTMGERGLRAIWEQAMSPEDLTETL